MRKPCKKTKVRAVIERGMGPYKSRAEGENSCDIEGAECPRVLQGYESGDGYWLCDTHHAEIAALENELEKYGKYVRLSAGTCYLYGIDWICRPCQHALRDANVRKIVFMEDEDG